MYTPIQRRQQYVHYIAENYSASYFREGRYGYTHKQWVDWYETHPLTEYDMDAAVHQWKYDFPMMKHSSDKIKAWEEEDTRSSNKQAKELRNGAWAAYLQQTCIAKQLAMSFLKFPSTMVRTLLQEWAEYMKSPEYDKGKKLARQS